MAISKFFYCSHGVDIYEGAKLLKGSSQMINGPS